MEISRVSTYNIRVGMIIADNVFDMNGNLIIAKDTTVDQYILNKISCFSVDTIPVYEINEPKTHSKIVTQHFPASYSQRLKESDEFKHFNEKFVQKTEEFKYELNDIADKHADIDIDSLFETTMDILDSTDNTMQVFDMLHNMRSFDDSTYAHSLNVSIIGNILAKWLNFNDNEIKIVTVAGLLHDIGKLLIPQEIITKAGKLTEDEFKTIKQHPVLGYNLLKDRKIDPRISQAALFHHEKCDGSGYPLGYKGTNIPDLAKLITIVDIYEAMTANRVYRKGVSPFGVIKLYEDEGFSKYDTRYLLTFLKGIAQTYINETVSLSDGRQGQIIFINQANLSNPIVKIGDTFLDLSTTPSVNIVEII